MIFKKKGRLPLAIFLIAFLSFVLTGCAANKETIGVLDIGKVMTESPKVKELGERYNAKGKELADALEAERGNISQEEYQQRYEAAYGELFRFKHELEFEIEQSIRRAVEEVSRERKVTVILLKDSIAYGGIDVTDDVMKKMQ